MTALLALTRHFVQALVSPPLLNDLGVDYLRRTLAGLVAMLLVAGIFLPRAFSKKYIDLGANLSPEPYHRALQADTLFMIAVPMLVISVIAVALGPMLFPDETDYRVLSPLPVTRAKIFAAKLAAIAVVAAICVVAVTALTSLWFPAVTGGWRQRLPLLHRVAAHAVATLAASAWAFTAMMAAQGVGLVVLPARWQQRFGLILQASMLVALLVTVPFVLRIPAMDVSAASVVQPPLSLVPATWFAGVEQSMLLGEQAGGYRDAARVAVWSAAFTLLAIAIAYGIVYRSAERLAGGAIVARRSAADREAAVRHAERRVAQPTLAVLSFVWHGLTRSRLHQFVFLMILGAGAALLIHQVLAVSEHRRVAAIQPQTAAGAGLAAPLVASLASVLALRMACLLPLDLAAAWVFRLTDADRVRAAALNGVAYAFAATAIVPAMAVAAVLQPGVLGPRVVASAPLTLLACGVLAEIAIADWRRLPFTCTYLPGKRVLAYTLGALLAVYAGFVLIGASVIRWGIAHPSHTMVAGGLLLAAFAALRRARLRAWGKTPLEFEDEDPAAVRTLGLLPDERP